MPLAEQTPGSSKTPETLNLGALGTATLKDHSMISRSKLEGKHFLQPCVFLLVLLTIRPRATSSNDICEALLACYAGYPDYAAAITEDDAFILGIWGFPEYARIVRALTLVNCDSINIIWPFSSNIEVAAQII